MVQSMTGYGKAECICGHNKITIEIRSVNGKSADISLKTQVIPRDKEIEIRQMITAHLQRGNIDLFASSESITETGGKFLNPAVFNSYFDQIEALLEARGLKADVSKVTQSVLRLPDIIDNQKKEEEETLKDENWAILKGAILDAVTQLKDFRIEEGKRLEEDICERVSLILKYLEETEVYDPERIETVKERLRVKFEEYLPGYDNNRFEQELIYYIEKLDITEEKVRLRQHCNYFTQTMQEEEYPGKKLGFIAQEMGREINTLGSKANHAQIQKIVVKMKDELEKIKEQTMNLV